MQEKRVGILGSGNVGKQLGLGFAKSGYMVKLGTRDPSKVKEWLAQAGSNASVGSFKDAAEFGEMVFICTSWTGTENAINLAGRESLGGKIVVDVTNPLKFEQGGQAPALALGYPDSGGRTIQKWLPDSKVVKAFNTITAFYMANPRLEEGEPDMFIAGNDKQAKEEVSQIAASWGWKVHDLGGIEQSYLLESLAMVWITYGFLNNHWTHAFKLLKK